MRAGQNTSARTATWPAKPRGAGAVALPKRVTLARREEQRAKSIGVVIACALIFVLIASAVLTSGHASIIHFFRSMAGGRPAEGTGDIVYTMPDGMFCRHASFDNARAEFNEGTVERCPDAVARDHGRGSIGFAWGSR
jgi:hypothetical protein